MKEHEPLRLRLLVLVHNAYESPLFDIPVSFH